MRHAASQALDELDVAVVALDRAVTGFDSAGIYAAVRGVTDATQAVAAQSAWFDDGQMPGRLSALLARIETLRIRVNFLTDFARQRVDMLTHCRRSPSLSLYQTAG